MKKAGVLSILFVVVLLAVAVIAEAQQPKQLPRIGYLAANFPSTNPARIEAFRQGLRDLGYVEGKSIVIEWRYAEGKPDRLPALAAELVRLKVDVIVSAGPPPTRSAKQATATIPFVMAFDNDPVGNGFVASLARPGGNITGLSTLAPEISGKHLELLKEIVPKVARVAVFGTSTQAGTPQALRERRNSPHGHSECSFNIRRVTRVRLACVNTYATDSKFIYASLTLICSYLLLLICSSGVHTWSRLPSRIRFTARHQLSPSILWIGVPLPAHHTNCSYTETSCLLQGGSALHSVVVVEAPIIARTLRA